MKKLSLFLALVLFVGTLPAKDLQWRKFNDGIAEAKRTGKKVLVDVYTDWCKWCKKMDEVTYKDAKVKEYLEKNFVLIKLNAEGSEAITYSGQKMSPGEFAQGMRIDGYPATLFLQANSEAITVLPGYSEPPMFVHVLTYIREDHYKSKGFDQYLAGKGVK